MPGLLTGTGGNTREERFRESSKGYTYFDFCFEEKALFFISVGFTSNLCNRFYFNSLLIFETHFIYTYFMYSVCTIHTIKYTVYIYK